MAISQSQHPSLSFQHNHRICFLIVCLALVLSSLAPAEDAIDRFAAKRLEKTHQALVALQAARKEVPRAPGPLHEYRANLQCPLASPTTAAGPLRRSSRPAKKAGTSVLMFTEHPAPHYDFVIDGHQGIKDGVLCIPGAEMKGIPCTRVRV